MMIAVHDYAYFGNVTPLRRALSAGGSASQELLHVGDARNTSSYHIVTAKQSKDTGHKDAVFVAMASYCFPGCDGCRTVSDALILTAS